MRIGRWSPESPGTEWPPFRLQTDDCPPKSGTVTEYILGLGLN